MKVNVDVTVDVSDQQRLDIANVIDGRINKPKRQATRDELKDFLWSWGKEWAEGLSGAVSEITASNGSELESVDDEFDDLI